MKTGIDLQAVRGFALLFAIAVVFTYQPRFFSEETLQWIKPLEWLAFIFIAVGLPVVVTIARRLTLAQMLKQIALTWVLLCTAVLALPRHSDSEGGPLIPLLTFCMWFLAGFGSTAIVSSLIVTVLWRVLKG